MLDTRTLAAEVVSTVKGFVSQQMEAFAKTVNDRFAALPVPENGKDGAEGAKGMDGAPGRDADPVDIEMVIKEVTARIPVPADGKDGPAGNPGAAGEPGAPGQAGEKGMDGRDGRDGKDGKDGRDGQDGADAFDIEIIESIDAEKKYRRGTVASHKGGLWYATKSTAGMDGWKCVVEGVAEIKVLLDGRNGSISVERSSGAADLHTFALPAMIYKGVFREGDAYESGDTVTWAGSLWHCNAVTRDKPIDGGAAWTLAARKGRDGKSA